MSLLSTQLTAKIITYRFNAYIDAQMTEELVSYIKTKKFSTKNTESSLRAQGYVNLRSNPSLEFLAGLAYTLYYGNGLANYLYTKSLSKIWQTPRKKELLKVADKYTKKILKTLTTDHPYQEFDHPKYLRTYWPQMVIDSFKWVDDFIQTRELPITRIDKKILKQTAVIVQKHNSQFNHQIARILCSQDKKRESDFVKVKLLLLASHEFDNPQTFINACARTEKAASKWDKLYTWIINN